MERRQCNNKAESPPEEEAFEFPSLSASSPSMIGITAGDIISGGKLLPFGAPTTLQQKYPPPPAEIIGGDSHSLLVGVGVGVRVGVGSSSRVSQRLAGGTYRKLRKLEEEEDANLPVSLGRKKPARSRWYVLAFGNFRSAAAAMELKEIRRRIRIRIRIIRQQHKSLDSMAAEDQLNKKKKKEWGPWKLLRSLTCMYI